MLAYRPLNSAADLRKVRAVSICLYIVVATRSFGGRSGVNYFSSACVLPIIVKQAAEAGQDEFIRVSIFCGRRALTPATAQNCSRVRCLAHTAEGCAVTMTFSVTIGHTIYTNHRAVAL